MSNKTQKIKRKYTLSKSGGKRLTMPNMSIDPQLALKQFRAGTFAEEIQTYYDSELAENMEDFQDFPRDLSKLTRLEKMELLNEVKDINKRNHQKLDNINKDNERAIEHNRNVDIARRNEGASDKNKPVGNTTNATPTPD